MTGTSLKKPVPEEWTISLGEATERLREKYGVTSQDQDEFAVYSHNLSVVPGMTASALIPPFHLSLSRGIQSLAMPGRPCRQAR